MIYFSLQARQYSSECQLLWCETRMLVDEGDSYELNVGYIVGIFFLLFMIWVCREWGCAVCMCKMHWYRKRISHFSRELLVFLSSRTFGTDPVTNAICFPVSGRKTRGFFKKINVFFLMFLGCFPSCLYVGSVSLLSVLENSVCPTSVSSWSLTRAEVKFLSSRSDLS